MPNCIIEPFLYDNYLYLLPTITIKVKCHLSFTPARIRPDFACVDREAVETAFIFHVCLVCPKAVE
jgi:hypothetical protein